MIDLARWGLTAAAALCFLRLAAATSAETDAEALVPLPEELPARYGVIGLRTQVAGVGTLRVEQVRLHSPAAAAGLRKGDLILGAPPYRLHTLDDLSRFVQSHAPDSSLVLLVGRDGREQLVRCRVSDRRRLYYLMAEIGTPAAPRAIRHDDWDRRTDGPPADAAAALIAGRDAGGVLDSLAAAFALELERYGADHRLGDIEYLLSQPVKTTTVAGDIVGDLTAGEVLSGPLWAAAVHLDAVPVGHADAVADDADSLFGELVDTELYDALLEPVARAGARARGAFSELSASEYEDLLSGAGPLLARFDRSFYLDRGDDAETTAHVQTLRLAKRVQLAELLAAGLELAALADPQSLRRIERAARRLSGRPVEVPDIFTGDFRLAVESPWGWVLVGDRGDNVYGGDAAVIVDLGGDDLYLGSVAGPAIEASRSIYAATDTRGLQARAPVGVVLDFGGDDRYVSNRPGALGSGFGGVGLLVDTGGDDTYTADRIALGAAFCGVGLLLDGGGDDVYHARQAAQGCAFYGAGLLVDTDGDDLYTAAQFSQGFGGARGLGLLLDGAGRDRYVADLTVPSGYGTRGIYNGWSQGVGCGFRGYAAGGIGVLADTGTDADAYQAGNFSQGTGYFFGLGVLADAGGDDRYIGTRYTQAASAHQAIGVLLDGGGNDKYRGAVAANQAGAWDVGIAVLVDADGDDSYHGAGLAQGAAAMNGFALLYDGGGADTYRASSGQGNGGSTDYWGGRRSLNLGLLIDAGGTDTYDRQGRLDGALVRDSRVGLFADH